ncbi:hypothetical protein HK104_010050 [Borealophlyctis nickersoniae]|nr:hypothetical protein HK104_010050 [Borealophlyctis nickersoniae]
MYVVKPNAAAPQSSASASTLAPAKPSRQMTASPVNDLSDNSAPESRENVPPNPPETPSPDAVSPSTDSPKVPSSVPAASPVSEERSLVAEVQPAPPTTNGSAAKAVSTPASSGPSPASSGDDAKVDGSPDPPPQVVSKPKPKPLFAPRTSSLVPTPAPPPKPQFSTPPPPDDAASSWTGFLKSRATFFGFNLGDENARGSDSDSDAEFLQQPRGIRHGSTDALISDLDPDSASYLVARLERENQALALNRKAVLVEDGNLRANQSIKQNLVFGSMSYSAQAPAPGQDGGDVEFWNSIIEDYASTLHKIPHLLTAKVRAGIPPHMRAKIWAVMTGAQKERFEALYPLLLKQESPFERIIQRDIPRTFPKLDMFKEEGGEGQRKLYNLLKAYSIFDAEVGYCQGLSFVVGPLLMQNMTEVEAFSVFVRLMEDTQPPTTGPTAPTNRRYALRTLFTPQMTGLHFMLHCHTEIIRAFLPRLHSHFQDAGITATMYASQWFLTLFTYNFPLPLVFRIFDIIIAEGAVETMLRFSIAILKRNEPALLAEEEFENILDLLKGDQLYRVYQDDPEKVLRDAMGVQDMVTTENLETIGKRYSEEQKKRAMAMSESELAALQALIRQLRSEASKGQQALAALGSENSKLQKENTELKETVKEMEQLKAEVEQLKAELEACRAPKGNEESI